MGTLTKDIVDAIDWHIAMGHAGEEFYFSKDGTFPRFIDSHNRPRVTVQKRLGLRQLSHHKLGRHFVGSQAAEKGHTLKAIQAQLGHRSEQSTMGYLHASNRSKLRLIQVWRLPRHLMSTTGRRAQRKVPPGRRDEPSGEEP